MGKRSGTQISTGMFLVITVVAVLAGLAIVALAWPMLFPPNAGDQVVDEITRQLRERRLGTPAP
jgi:hypothetical protein